MLGVVGYRGESSGKMFTEFDLSKTAARVGFFFATEEKHARSYAAPGTPARKFSLETGRVLDLTKPHSDSVKPFLAEYQNCYDEWIDRYSGETLSLYDLADTLETGMLYAYEGTGTGGRWNTLFRLARNQDYDSVCVFDATDGAQGESVQIWVLFDPARISVLSN